MKHLAKHLADSLKALRKHTQLEPEIGLILGTALGNVTENMSVETIVPYHEIPHFQPSNVESHAGELVFGSIKQRRVTAMRGRFHLYEGYSMSEIAYPSALMHALGVKTLIVTNAAGGAEPRMQEGDVMMIDDHINLLWKNPLIGLNDDSLGPRFPDMMDAYSVRLMDLAEASAARQGIRLWRGTYAFVAGPNFETKAELRLLRALGADAIGWSTVPEVIMARYLGMEVLGFTIVTDMSVADRLHTVDMDRLMATGLQGADKLRTILEDIIPQI
ncbi:MAG: purine-nucleoside phosphorylase [Anaerolineales bacterium]